MTSSFRLRPAFLLAALAALAGCSRHELAKPAAPLSQPTRLCNTNGSAPACRSAQQVEQLLTGDLRILGMHDTPSGMQGAKLLTVQGNADGRSTTFRVRWRAQSSADVINEPRKELAAYAVQKLFLDDHELVAPPTAAHCFPLAEYRRFVPQAKPSFGGADCVLGFATYWLEGVKSVSGAREAGWFTEGSEGRLWDPQLFAKDAMYRASLGKCNLLTHLINHGDAHAQQLVFEKTPRGLRAYVVDNSIAFLSIKNPLMLFGEDWSKLQVPFLPPQAIDRLKALTERDLARLKTIQELELRAGRLVTTEPTNQQPSGDEGMMSLKGTRLRIGLTEAEIELVAERIRELLARPDLSKLTEPT
jgi:hypothetical protein